MPACAIIASSPAVFSATVLPPVFGPLMMSCRFSGSRPSVSGTITPPFRRSRRSSSGWRPLLHQKLRRVVSGEGRRGALVLFCEARPRLQRIHFRQDRGARRECLRLARDLARHLHEDAMDLGLLLIEQADQLVVLLDGLERLNVDRLAAAAGAVHHAGNAPLPLRFHRDDEALAADGDQVFLRRAFTGESAQRLPQAALRWRAAAARSRGGCASGRARHRR